MVPGLLSGYLGDAGILPGEEVRSRGTSSSSLHPLRGLYTKQEEKSRAGDKQDLVPLEVITKYLRGRRREKPS